MSIRKAIELESLQSKSFTTVWAFYFLAAAAFLSAVSQILLMLAITRLKAGDPALTEVEGRIATMEVGAGCIQIVVSVVVLVAFLTWFFSAHKNLSRAGLQTTYATGWTIGGFLIPFLNLVRPYQVMKELWQGSEYLAEASDDDDWKQRKAGSLVGQWWVLFLVAAIARSLASEAVVESDDLSATVRGAYALLASNLIDGAGALITAALVRQITAFQEKARNRKDLGSVDPGEDSALGKVTPG